MVLEREVVEAAVQVTYAQVADGYECRSIWEDYRVGWLKG